MKGKIKKALSIFLAMCAISTVFQLSSYSVDADSAPVASGGGTASESAKENYERRAARSLSDGSR